MIARYCFKFYKAVDKFNPSMTDVLVDAGVFTEYQAAERCRLLQSNNNGYIYFIRHGLYDFI